MLSRNTSIKNMKLGDISSDGFTIVELIVVILVIGILASVSIISYSGWQKSIVITQLKNDLGNAARAMEASRNFGISYPLSVPNTFSTSEGVTLAGGSYDNETAYCFDATSSKYPDIQYYIENNNVEPQEGNCLYRAKFISIALGSYFSCGINLSNQVYCWGNNSQGQLGNNSLINSSVPIAVNTSGVLNGKTIKAVAAGWYHACVIASDDKAYCWGDNSVGQLGNNSLVDSLVPVAVEASGLLNNKVIESIAAGGNTQTGFQSHTCVITSEHKAYCWGSGGSGQLGTTNYSNSSVPVAVSTGGVLTGLTILSISTGLNHTCVIASNNKPYCWGTDLGGQLGNDMWLIPVTQPTPVAVQTTGLLSGKTVSALSVTGAYHSCVIASDLKAYCWGDNLHGALGSNLGAVPMGYPDDVYVAGVLSGKTMKAIATGQYNTCAIASDDKAYCWGDNVNGTIGNNTINSSNVPRAVYDSGLLSNKIIKTVAVGGSHACATDIDNKIYCWGGNSSGQLGNNLTTNSLVPVHVELP